MMVLACIACVFCALLLYGAVHGIVTRDGDGL